MLQSYEYVAFNMKSSPLSSQLLWVFLESQYMRRQSYEAWVETSMILIMW